jgi:RNA ligase
MKLSELLDIELLEQRIRDGYVTVRLHPDLPLRIFNYTSACQFENVWDEITTQTRGLIVSDIDTVVSRPLRKFFNFNTSYRPETHEANLPFEIPEVYAKEDGCAGIYWQLGSQRGIATRGSFESTQSKWATKHYLEHYSHVDWPAGVTPFFEIISPVSQIVVDYKGFEGLILLSVVDNRTGSEWSFEEIQSFCKANNILQVARWHKTLSECVAEQKSNSEGYVLFYRPSGLRLKVKFNEYCRLHKLLTGVSPKQLWEIIKDACVMSLLTADTSNMEELVNERLKVLYDNTTTQFSDWVWGWRNNLINQYYGLLNRAYAVYDSRPADQSRRAIAEHFLAYKDVASICFQLYDNSGLLSEHGMELIWKQLRPKVDKQAVFKKDIDR